MPYEKERSKKLRVMRVLPDLGNGGLQCATLDFLDHCPPNIEVSVAAVVNGGCHQKEFEARCATVIVGHEAGDPFRSYLWFDPARILRLAQAMRKLRPDVVQTHTFPAAVVGKSAAKIAGVPVIVDVLHNTYTWKQQKDLRIDRWLSRITDRIVCSSYAVRDFAIEQNPDIPASKYEVIYDGVDTTRYYPRREREETLRRFNIDPKKRVIGSVSRLVKQKRVTDLISAAPDILRQFPHAHFLVAGEGPVLNQLIEQAHKAELENFFTFTGLVRDTENIYAAFDVFAQTAEREGFGLSMSEAMASGIAVVAARAGAVPEIVQDMHNGLLYEPGDVSALATGICALLKDDGVRKRLGAQAAKDIPSKFSFEVVPGQYEELWNRLLVART